jgi:hypothetical protein
VPGRAARHYARPVTSSGTRPTADLDRLRADVVADPGLLSRLLTHRERSSFTDAVCALAAERGLAVTPAEVDEALRAARRAWLERWV